MKPIMKKQLGLLLALAACFGGSAAAPTLPQVVAGQATFSQQGNVFSITNAPGTIINWDSFSVAAGEVTRFIQQGSDSAVLNRVTGQDPSRILGALQSNGQVFLINPNGILFGKDARVDVAGLTASTLDIANGDFLAGRRSFTAGAKAGAIDNQGSIATPAGGKVYLIAPTVENSGIVTTPDGQVVLAAGRSVQLVDSNNPDLHVVVSAPQDAAVNLGQVVAQGGRIGIYGALVRQQGLVNADSAQVGANGKIVLKASGETLLTAGSVTSATGAGKGGDIRVLGERVGITGNAQVDASGRQGGGSVLVGGGWQGKNPLLPNARQTLLGKDASIRADALDAGNGGTVVLWADGATRANGRISARGGLLSGDGGQVETSAGYLDVAGLRVDTAAKGQRGTWLLDPYNIEIVSIPTGTTLDDVDSFAEPVDNGTTQLSADVLSGASASSNVVLQARNDVTFNAAVQRPNGTSGSLTVEAGNNITVNGALDTRGGALVLKANQAPYATSAGTGAITFNNTVSTGGGDFSATAKSIHLNGSGKLLDAGAVSLNATTFEMYSGSELTSGGHIDIVADNVALAGSIGPSAGELPMVSFIPATRSRAIAIKNLGEGGRDSSLLHLLPLELGNINAESINIGSTASTGAISVLNPLSLVLTRNLVLETQGAVAVNAPVTLAVGTGGTMLWNVVGGGTFTLSGYAGLQADNVIVRADSMALGGTITNAGLSDGTIALMPSSGATAILAGNGASGSSSSALVLDSAELANLQGSGHITIGGNDGQYGGVTVSGLTMLTGSSGSPSLSILAGDGNLLFSGSVSTDRQLKLQGNRIETSGSSQLTAPSIELSAFERIGDSENALRTITSYLSATNHNPRGSGVINVYNSGVMSLGDVLQSGTANNGAISILNDGGMTLPAGKTVRTGGAVSLRTRSPLTIAGSVHTSTGAVKLEAGNGGVLTVEEGATVSSGGGISATGGSIVNNGSLSTTSGTITTVGPVTGTGTMVQPDAPGGPTLAECVANPTMSGCAGVLPTVDACIATPAAEGCSVVLPTLQVCAVTPTIKGCSVQLPSAATCAAAPSTLGCAAVLPTVESCVVTPSAPGCAAVLPTLDACISQPSTPGCSAVLPSPAVCAANPATPGCAPSVDVCVAKPSTPGCAAVLPTLAQCIAAPSTQGCAAVLPTISQCVAAPSTQGCAVVLPTLGQCVANPATQGCAVVLPSLQSCSVTPSLEGCQAVLPTIGQCVVNPAAPGCQAVLPTIGQCIVNPATQGCGAVLPSLQTCVVTPSAQGCGVVLPTLSACVAAPATAGCAAVLPTLAQCVDSPTLQGCSVVLPPVDACVANPSAPGCVVVAPPKDPAPGSPVQEAANTAINLINQASDNAASVNGARAAAGTAASSTQAGPAEDKKSGQDAAASNEGAGTAASDSTNQGGKSAKLVKTYCN